MANHGSASTREEASHVTQTTRTATIIDALKRRAQAVLNDRSLDPQSRAILRYALETNDPWLAKMVQQAETGQPIIDKSNSSQILQTNASQTSEAGIDFSSETKIDILSDLICRPGDEPATKSAALLVLMSTLEHSTESKELANQAKHFAFARCGDLNLHGIVDTQAAMLETVLFAGNTP